MKKGKLINLATKLRQVNEKKQQMINKQELGEIKTTEEYRLYNDYMIENLKDILVDIKNEGFAEDKYSYDMSTLANLKRIIIASDNIQVQHSYFVQLLKQVDDMFRVLKNKYVGLGV